MMKHLAIILLLVSTVLGQQRIRPIDLTPETLTLIADSAKAIVSDSLAGVGGADYDSVRAIVSDSLGFSVKNIDDSQNKIFFTADTSLQIRQQNATRYDFGKNGSVGLGTTHNDLWMINANGTRGDITNPVRGLVINFTNNNKTSSTGMYTLHSTTGDSSRDHIVGYQGQCTNGGTGDMNYLYGVYQLNTNNSTGSLTSAYGYYYNGMTGTGTTTNNYGVYIASQSHGTNIYGLYSNVLTSGGSNPWNLYMVGTASNYMAGSLGVGTNSIMQKIHLQTSSGTSAYIRLQQAGQNYWDVGCTASQTYFRVTDVGDRYFQVAANGDVSGTHGTYHTSSDKRLKRDIEPIDNALERLGKMQGVYYHWINPGEHDHGEGRKAGLIAQDVETGLPEAVYTQDDSMRIKNIQSDAVIGLLVQSVNELHEEVLIHRYVIGLLILTMCITYFRGLKQ